MNREVNFGEELGYIEEPDGQRSEDSQAKTEGREIDREDYEEITEKQLDHRDRGRQDDARKTFHKLFKHGLRAAAFAVVLILFVRVWHLIGPESWRWLVESDVTNIDRMLFSGALGGVVARHLGSILYRTKK